jgi:hypothetical protein
MFLEQGLKTRSKTGQFSGKPEKPFQTGLPKTGWHKFKILKNNCNKNCKKK